MIEIKESKTEEIKDILKTHWGSEKIVSKGKIHFAGELKGLSAFRENKFAGLITYNIIKSELEIVSLNSFEEITGIGTTLIEKVKEIGREKRSRRIWLITTNDNTNALRFYQKRGFDLKAIYRNQIRKSRKIKPEIPLMGFNGIEIKHEIELEYIL